MTNIITDKKLRFAMEYMKSGRNAAEAGRAIGVTRARASQLLKTKAVQAYIEEIEQMLSLDKLAQPDCEQLGKDIASINDILKTLTKIINREETEDVVVVPKNGGREDHEQEAVIVTKRASLADVNKAAATMIKYYQSEGSKPDGEAGGVIILPE